MAPRGLISIDPGAVHYETQHNLWERTDANHALQQPEKYVIFTKSIQKIGIE